MTKSGGGGGGDGRVGRRWSDEARLPQGLVLNCFIHSIPPPTKSESEIPLSRAISSRRKETCVCVCVTRVVHRKTSSDTGASVEGFLLTPEHVQGCAEEPRR